MNEWHLRQKRSVPIVYGWTEAHACAGHAVAILATGGCLQCGLTEHGESRSPVSTWPKGSPIRGEPACGASFQPYGPIELSYVSALVAELSLDCLLGRVTASTQRTWIGRRSLLEDAGGEWTPEWRKRAEACPQGGFIDERPWLTIKGCPECKASS